MAGQRSCGLGMANIRKLWQFCEVLQAINKLCQDLKDRANLDIVFYKSNQKQ